MKRWRKSPLRAAACALALTLLAPSLSGCAAWPRQEAEQQEKEIAAPVQLSSLRIEKEILPENTKTDEAYMQGNRGFFLPDDTITRAEIAQVYWNLHLSVPGSRTFSDVAPGDWFAQAVAELSGALKGYSDGTFRPQQEATLAEFLTVLCRVLELKPPALEDGAGQPWYAPYLLAAQEAGWLDAHPDAQADAPVTRAVAVSILNRALGREPDREAIDRLDVCVYLDVTPEHPDYYDILEASITHTCNLDRDGAWIEKSLELPNLSAGIHLGGGSAYYVLEDRTLYREPGLLEVDGARYLVVDETGRIYADEALHQYGEELVFSTESGALLCNGSWHDFQFDDQGYYTTGYAELDGYVEEALAACTDETMTQAEKLYAAYCYVRSFGYLGRNSTIYVKTMSPTQASAYAKKIFSTGKGDCYNFAAAFYYLARRLGYDATAVVGSCGYVWNTRAIPHGWVEIPIDGATYLFDPQIENYNNRNGISNETHGAFQVTYATAPANYYPN